MKDKTEIAWSEHTSCVFEYICYTYYVQVPTRDVETDCYINVGTYFRLLESNSFLRNIFTFPFFLQIFNFVIFRWFLVNKFGSVCGVKVGGGVQHTSEL